MQRFESFENPLAAGSHSFGSQDNDRVSSSNQQFGTALYDFTAGGDDEVICLGCSFEIMEIRFAKILNNQLDSQS